MCYNLHQVVIMLEIKDLTVNVLDKEIIHDFNLTINDGEIHVLMGPNGTGKSTICKTILGDDNYKIIMQIRRFVKNSTITNNFLYQIFYSNFRHFFVFLAKF